MLNRILADGSTSHDDSTAGPKTVWFDLVDPDSAEIATIGEIVGVALPTLEDVGDVRFSGRFRRDADSLRLSIPFNPHTNAPQEKPDPLGIVLTAGHLVTLRSGRSLAVEKAGRYMSGAATHGEASVDALMALIQSIADGTTDLMEDVAEDLADMSQALFNKDRRDTAWLRAGLHTVGQFESQQAHLRNSTQGLTRMLNFICESRPDWMSDASVDRVAAMRKSMKSLGDFDDQLTVKLQFLLDAILGFINTDQNEIMKLLTVASVATIPPIILVGIWGMNFRHMPELKWSFGYPLALLAILLSLVLPLLWFKRRGWI